MGTVASQLLVVVLAAVAVAISPSCDGDSDGDSDADSDADIDSDADGDADEDSDEDHDEDHDWDFVPECDPVSDVGCAPGEKCTFHSHDGITFGVACVRLPGELAGPGELCDVVLDAHFGSYDNCPGGYLCLSSGDDDDPTCEALCLIGDASHCADAYPDGSGGLTVDGLCISSIEETMPVPGLKVCVATHGCSAACQDCPAPGDGCYAASDGHNAGTFCLPFDRGEQPGEGDTGDVCELLEECAPGHHCVADECRPYCDPDAPAGPDGDADVDADVDADGDADADADEEPPCPGSRCEDHPGSGTCQVPPESDPLFGDRLGLGVCLP